jgi:adenylate cyclase class IV
MAAPRRNIELKAIDPDPAGSLEVCRALGAQDEGVLWQRDSYFNVSTGGLKLREQQPGRAHLIQFERAEEPQQRESRYRIIETDDPQTLLAALTATLGVNIAVTKRRRLFLWRNVRIHLDDVERLGTFIELEAVAPADSDLQHEHALVKQLREAFSITDDRLSARGYAQQLVALSIVELVERVRAIPYGRPSKRTVQGMLREQRGTCSTKHLYLAQQLMQRFPTAEPEIIHRVYRLDRDRARTLFGEKVAQTIPPDGLIDVIAISRSSSKDNGSQSTRRSPEHPGTGARRCCSRAALEKTFQRARTPTVTSRRWRAAIAIPPFVSPSSPPSPNFRKLRRLLDTRARHGPARHGGI